MPTRRRAGHGALRGTVLRVSGVCLLLLAGVPVQAQSAHDKLRSLFHFGTCDTLVCLNVGTSSAGHGSHFNPDAAITLTSLINFLDNGIGTSVSDIPLGGTSSGTTITFDANGMPVTTHGSSGPIFGERSQTLGRGRALFGINVTGAKFDKLRGVELSDLNSTLTHEDVAPSPDLGNPQYEFDTLHVHTDLDASFTATTIFLTYGLTNRVDIGVAVPIVSFTFSGTSTAQLFNTYGGTLHYFRRSADGSVTLADTTSSSSSTRGLGDIALRLKVNLAQSPRSGAALFTAVRLPTGERENLLGTGYLSAQGLAVLWAHYGAFSPHVNAGYRYRGGSGQNSAALGTVGFDLLAGPAVTLSADALGQWQIGASKLTLPPPVTFDDGSVIPRTTIPEEKDNVLGASVGAKLSLGQDFTAVANVILPLNNGGLRSRAVWTVGLEKNFGVRFTK
ncbi:MAG TPA: hypothetical protein VFW98_16145 [Gemmatimonadaceae bacterium]|nr:hypothetical protein [Gemmatimonadaceae bacterium]